MLKTGEIYEVFPFKASFLGMALMAFGLSAAQGVPDSGGPAPDANRNMAQQVTDIHEQVKDIHRVTVESPLEGKSWGVEVDPVTPLFIQGKTLLLFGTVSNFSLQRTAEIAFPLSYQHFGTDGGQTVVSVDADYRYFLSGVQRGFYVSAFARYEMEHYKSYSFDTLDNVVRKNNVANRLGIGFGIGDRIFSRAGWYWGWSLYIGRFLTGNDNSAGNSFDDDVGSVIFDAELLKIGFAF